MLISIKSSRSSALSVQSNDAQHTYKWQLKLEGCIVLNKHNTVFARSSPLYATGVSLGPPESSTQTASRSFQPFLQGSLGYRSVWQTDRPRYLVGNNRRSAQWRSQILLLSMATTSIYWSSRLNRSDQLQQLAAIFSCKTRWVAV